MDIKTAAEEVLKPFKKEMEEAKDKIKNTNREIDKEVSFLLNFWLKQ